MKKKKDNYTAVLKVDDEISIYGNGKCKKDALKELIMEYYVYKKIILPNTKDNKELER